MATFNQLNGSCACERNQYMIVIPNSSSSLAQVFFDNSAVSRRAQASPVTAWLRIPLDWYQSITVAQFPDESHSSIRRTYHAPTPDLSLPPTRKTFCGYCGAHLTQWNEAQHSNRSSTSNADYLDVTLGSLYNESLEKLEALNILPDSESDDASATESADVLATRDSSNEETRIATREAAGADPSRLSGTVSSSFQPLHLMNGRGMPFFEEMINHSQLGRIKRRVGAHTSRDGTTSVRWEIIDVGTSLEHDHPMTGTSAVDSGNKRQKLDS